jgi:hypothetical protein
MPDKKMEQIILKPGPRKGPTTPNEELLWDFFTRLAKNQDSHLDAPTAEVEFPGAGWFGTTATEETPPLPRQPYGFRPQTRAPLNIAKDVEHVDPYQELMRIVPDLEGRVKSVQYGPTPAVLRGQLSYLSRFMPMEKTNLAGMYDRRANDIAISEELDNAAYPHAFATMAHELTHALGWNHGKTIDKAEELANVVSEPLKKDYYARYGADVAARAKKVQDEVARRKMRKITTGR